MKVYHYSDYIVHECLNNGHTYLYRPSGKCIYPVCSFFLSPFLLIEVFNYRRLSDCLAPAKYHYQDDYYKERVDITSIIASLKDL